MRAHILKQTIESEAENKYRDNTGTLSHTYSHSVQIAGVSAKLPHYTLKRLTRVATRKMCQCEVRRMAMAMVLVMMVNRCQ